MADAGAIQGGLHEILIGTDDPVAAIRYWQGFGYRVGETGELDAKGAKALYGVEARLRSIRLLHQDSDHGLIRLMQWDGPMGPGLGMASWRVQGARWGAALTENVYEPCNHAEVLKSLGGDIAYVEPIWAVIHQKAAPQKPFEQPLVGVREMAMTQPLWRQVFFQRFGYQIPTYGKVNPAAHFRTSQFTHCGMVVQDDSPAILDFYADVLGLLRTNDVEVPWEMAKGSRAIFDLREGEWHALVDFDGPDSSTDYAKAKSGRLKILRFRADSRLEDLRDRSRPGHRGMCGYTYRARNLAVLRDRLAGADLDELSPLAMDEFGRPALTFTAPDGYHWTLFEEGA